MLCLIILQELFLEKCSYQLPKKNDKSFIDSMIMLRFGDTKVVKLL